MTTGIVINARCGSSRLPDKHLIKICGRTAISWLIDRLPKDNLWIATGNRRDNQELEFAAKKYGASIFYGDPVNIPKRHLALAKTARLDAIVSIDGDDLLTSPKAIADVLKELGKHPIVNTKGLPHGMNVLWAYTRDALEKSVAENPCRVNDTNWGWIFNKHPILTLMYDGFRDIRLTLDYPEDLKIFQQIFGKCHPSIMADDRKLTDWIING